MAPSPWSKDRRLQCIVGRWCTGLACKGVEWGRSAGDRNCGEIFPLSAPCLFSSSYHVHAVYAIVASSCLCWESYSRLDLLVSRSHLPFSEVHICRTKQYLWWDMSNIQILRPFLVSLPEKHWSTVHPLLESMPCLQVSWDWAGGRKGHARTIFSVCRPSGSPQWRFWSGV